MRDATIASAPNPASDDRAWFARNPGRSFRARPLDPAEVPELDLPPVAGDGVWCAAVRRLAPDVRVRVAIYLPSVPQDTDKAAGHAFLMAAAVLGARGFQ